MHTTQRPECVDAWPSVAQHPVALSLALADQITDRASLMGREKLPQHIVLDPRRPSASIKSTEARMIHNRSI